MKIVLDSNILFSALIKDSLTRRLILEYDENFIFPYYIFEELTKHKAELLTKSQMDGTEFEQLLQLLLTKVIIIQEDILDSYKIEAINIINHLDPDDTMFIACALAYPGSVIWSNDKRLALQNKIKIISTKEMIELI